MSFSLLTIQYGGKNMIIVTHFSSQIIPLALSFGVSYWLLVTSNKFETRLRPVGETLGWTLITLTLISFFFSFLYSVRLTNNAYVRDNCPVIKIIEQQKQPLLEDQQTDDMDNGQNMDDAESDDNINNQLHETYTPGEGKPVQTTSKDH